MKILLLMMISTSLHAMDVTYTYINGERVAEFGDKGKAANQYPTEVGRLNVISPVIVTQHKGKTYVDRSFFRSARSKKDTGQEVK